MLTPRSSFLRARNTFVEPRLIGFLNANRRILAVSAIAATGLLTSIPSLPAQADSLFAAAPVEVPSQSYVVPAGYLAPVHRDAFAISTYSVVQWPMPQGTTISSGYGPRVCDGCSTFHNGIDFDPGNGYPIQVVADGVVTEAGWDSTGYGNKVVVQHVIDGQTVSTLYAHMQDGSIAVAVGETIKRGTVLGLVGETGVATGPHLHFGVLVDDSTIDPYPWLVAHVNI
ncbi:MAG: M23 family metallopeptidase [Salinibacterium sp.]|nr:M23 family metallopeptidase [Salinibacterium sp.]